MFLINLDVISYDFFLLLFVLLVLFFVGYFVVLVLRAELGNSLIRYIIYLYLYSLYELPFHSLDSAF